MVHWKFVCNITSLLQNHCNRRSSAMLSKAMVRNVAIEPLFNSVTCTPYSMYKIFRSLFLFPYLLIEFPWWVHELLDSLSDKVIKYLFFYQIPTNFIILAYPYSFHYQFFGLNLNNPKSYSTSLKLSQNINPKYHHAKLREILNHCIYSPNIL